MKSKNTTAIIVIHEIYGVNDHMHRVCESLDEQGFHVFCPNLLDREPFGYDEEDLAYQYFIEKIGFTNSAEKIKQLIIEKKRTYDKLLLVGFSVGATIAWLCSEENDVDGIVGYYGSRIRNYMKLEPQCPTLLFYPEHEQSFDVDELTAKLSSKQIHVHKLQGQHGFSNPYSQKYQKDSAQQALNEMLQFLNDLL